MAFSRNLYNVVENASFQRQAASLVGSIKAWDEIRFHFFDQYVVRNPKVGQLVPGTYLYAFRLLTNPQLILFYTINDDAGHVELIGIRKA